MSKLALLAVLALPTVALAKKPPAYDADAPNELQITEEIKVVFHVTHDVWKKGAPKTLWYLDRLVNTAYPEKYGVPQENLDFKLLAHDQPVYWFLNDEGWKKAKGKDHAAVTDHNPHKELIQGLIDAGVDIEVCEVTLKSKGWSKDDLLPGVKTTKAGVPRLIDLQLMGYTRMTLE